MTETLLAPQIIEHQESLQPVVGLYNQLATPEAEVSFLKRMNKEREAFDYQGELARIYQGEDQLAAKIQSINNDPSLEDRVRIDKIDEMQPGLDDFRVRADEAKFLESFMQDRSLRWNSRGIMLFESGEDQVQPLIAAIKSSAKTTESEFVGDRRFINLIDQEKPEIRINADREPIEVPLSSIVSAVAFEDWENGRGPGFTKNTTGGTKNSAEIMSDYAARPTEIPAIHEAVALILPNGEVVFMTNDSHRVGAARLRDQASIKIKNMIIREAIPLASSVIETKSP